MSSEPAATTAARPGTAAEPAAVPALSAAQAELEAFLTTLLEAQCRLASAVAGVIILAPTRARRGGLAARFHADPSDADLVQDPALLRRLERIAGDVMAPAAANGASANGRVESITVAKGGVYEAEPTHRVLACPLKAEGRTEGVSLLMVPGRRQSDPSEALLRVALTSARFETYLWRQQCLSEAQQKAKLRETLELLDAAMQGQSAEAMASLMCHELKRRFGCTRVSIGLIRRGRVRAAAVSGADELDGRGPAVAALEAAMEECADQDIEVVFPPPPEAELDPAERRVVRAHEQLSAKFGPAAILSLPLRVEGDLVGVVMLERDPADPFPPGSVGLLRLVAEFIGPTVWTRRLADRGVLAVVRDRTLDLGEAIVGPRHTGAKMIGLVAAAALAGLAVIPIPSRVSADAELEATVSRTIPPPFVGYLSSVHVKPGDRVEQGQVLASLDERELRVQLAELQAGRESLRAQRDQAMAEGDAGKKRALDAAVAEATAKIAYIEDRLAHAAITAPIAGVVSRGKLDALVGARVEPTQPLFEIVGERQVVSARIDERDIGRVSPGQEGTIAIKAMPGHKLPVRVGRVNPTAEPVRGANVYLVELEVLEPAPWLRPGMTGAVKLRDGWTTGLRALTRPLIDELRMRFWW